MNSVPILYSGFYDFPLAFVARYLGKTFLFWREFDDDLDDYPMDYQVFELPPFTDEEVIQSWGRLPNMALRTLSNVPIRAIKFDTTHRKEIGTELLISLVTLEQAVAA